MNTCKSVKSVVGKEADTFIVFSNDYQRCVIDARQQKLPFPSKVFILSTLYALFIVKIR